MYIKSIILALSCASVALAQLADTTDYPIGPLTSSSAKWAKKVCNITNYGAVADGKTDSLGTFAMATWVTLSGGTAWAINLEGIIVRTGTAGGNMIYIEHSTDFEIYSSRGVGAIQGYGYQFHEQGEYGPRLLRLYDGEWALTLKKMLRLIICSNEFCYP